MIPKIEFRYSSVYDRNYRESKSIQKYLKKRNEEYPSREEVIKYMKKAEKLWRKSEKKILIEISRITKLKWKEKRIICYIIGVGRSFSEPLTVRTFGKLWDRFIDVLTHELIHNIFNENNDKYMKWYNYVFKKYSKELRATKTHIVLCAVHWKLLLKLFGEERLKKEIKRYKEDIDYKRAWEIVEKESPDVILNKFYKLIK
jgi:hypothetical protein